MEGTVRFSNGIQCFIHNKPVVRMGIEVLCSRGVCFGDWFTFRPSGPEERAGSRQGWIWKE